MIIHLPSNACIDEFQNENTNFTVRLPKEIHTSGYGVALRSIVVPLSHYNISGSNVRFWYAPDCPVKDETKLKVSWNTEGTEVSAETVSGQKLNLIQCDINDGHYDVSYLLGWMRWVLKPEDRNLFRFKFDDTQNRVHIAVPKNKAIIWPRKLTRLGQICGFDQEVLTSGIHVSRFEPFTRFGLDFVNVTCNLIEPQLYAGTLLPVLRTLPFRGQRGSFISFRFRNPYFFPVNRDSINTVSIALTDESGKLLTLERGITIAVLELKKV